MNELDDDISFDPVGAGNGLHHWSDESDESDDCEFNILKNPPPKIGPDLLGDPVCDETYTNLWLKRAEENTQVCDKYFLEQPANHHTTLEVQAQSVVCMYLKGLLV